jgi:hypothetical protein
MSKNPIGEISDKSLLDCSQKVNARDISNSNIIKIDNLTLRIEKDLSRKEPSLQLPTIQDVLRKNQINDGDFFRSYLCWADLEQNFVLERKEVNEIIKKLETSAIQLVVGGPASGKSTMLKNIGYKLANHMDVYYFDLKRYSDEEINELFEEIDKIRKASVFIVDDAHLFPEECKKLITNFKKNGKGRLIMGSRDSPRISSHPKEFNEFQIIENIKISPYNISNELIELFLKKRYKSEDIKVKIAINELETYKKDLWLFLSEYPAARCGWDGQETDLRMIAYSL